MGQQEKTVRDSDKADDERVPIWSVPKNAWGVYVFIFIVLWPVFAVALWGGPTDAAIKEYIRNLASTTIAIAGLAFALAEWGYMLVVLGTRLKEHFNKQQQRRDEQIRSEAVREWAAWNKRRLDAEQRGEPFEEPPPSQ